MLLEMASPGRRHFKPKALEQGVGPSDESGVDVNWKIRLGGSNYSESKTKCDKKCNDEEFTFYKMCIHIGGR